MHTRWCPEQLADERGDSVTATRVAKDAFDRAVNEGGSASDLEAASQTAYSQAVNPDKQTTQDAEIRHW